MDTRYFVNYDEVTHEVFDREHTDNINLGIPHEIFETDDGNTHLRYIDDDPAREEMDNQKREWASTYLAETRRTRGADAWD